MKFQPERKSTEPFLEVLQYQTNELNIRLRANAAIHFLKITQPDDVRKPYNFGYIHI